MAGPRERVVGVSRPALSRVAVVVLLFSTFRGAAAAKTNTIEPTIYVSNESQLADDLVIATLPAFQAAVDEDFAPAWRADATLRSRRETVGKRCSATSCSRC